MRADPTTADLLAHLADVEAREAFVAELPARLAPWSGDDVRDLGSGLVGLLTGTAPTVVKSFAALALIDVAAAGGWDETWNEPVLHWWTREDDQRGFDPVDGWIHAVAHGADLVGELALRGLLDPARALGACGRRLIAPTEFVWADGEDDRVALAIVRVLSRIDEAGESVAWLSRVGGYLVSPQPTPPDPSHANTLRTLRSVLVLLDVDAPVAGARRTPPHAAQVRERLLAVLTAATPWLWRHP